MTERTQITLLQSPIETLRLFGLFILEAWAKQKQRVVKHWSFLPVTCIVLFLLTLKYFSNGPHDLLINWLEGEILFIVWWTGLGILSSVGLGTGMHTGVLFLFPHILSVSIAASKCRSTDFNSREMWFMNKPPFECNSIGTEPVGFLQIFYKVFWPCFLWGTGTALGEIPPYWISRQASLAHEANHEFDEITSTTSGYAFLDRMKRWMIDFLQHHGFLGILLMAAWPNAAFDLCGICCGHFLMPFGTFLLAVWIGKALIKVNGQALFFITIFTPEHLKSALQVVDSLFPDAIDPCKYFAGKGCHLWLEDKLQDQIAKNLNGTSATTKEASFGLQQLWGWFIGFAMLYFLKTAIEQIAQMKAGQLERQKNGKQKAL